MSTLDALKRTVTVIGFCAALAALLSTAMTVLLRLVIYVIRLLFVYGRRQPTNP